MTTTDDREACVACGSDDIEHEDYGVRCLTCGYVEENEDGE